MRPADALLAFQSTEAIPPSPPRWHVVESVNFRVLNYGVAAISRELTEHCERVRSLLAERWSVEDDDTIWSPKCELVLHPTDSAYQQAVGKAGSRTIASALVDRRDGRITLRRIDIRVSHRGWEVTALPHELTHVVLADRFAKVPLPRWADEGTAILADSYEKRNRHGNELRRTVAMGAHFRLVELVSLADYPPAGRWSVFYDQSAAIVAYLVELQGHARFLDFVELSLETGQDRALQRIYGCDVLQLERRWLESLSQAPIRALTKDVSVHPSADGKISEL